MTTTLGEQLKEEGMAAAMDASPTWSQQARAWIEDLPAGQDFTSEDLTFWLGLPRIAPGIHRNNAVGAVVNGAARSHLIAKTGYESAHRALSHGSVLARWVRL
jgi:hypothetical protein